MLKPKLKAELVNNYYDFVREHLDTSTHYVFTSQYNLVYSVYFNSAEFSDYLDDLPYLSKNGILFGFFPIDENAGKKNFDPLIAETIYRIIEDYFRTYGKEKVLLFHCDSHDEKQKCRDKLFEKWYIRKPPNLLFLKDNLEIEIEREDGSLNTEYLGFIICGEESAPIDIVKKELIEISAIIITRKR